MTAPSDERKPDPDALLASASREGKGSLKIFLGAAPGVGKTWAMLAAARRKLDAGEDVAAGVIETHGRAETAAQIGNLPVLPLTTIIYRGQPMPEFDLDGALARHPGLLLVDELAHTNVPGGRHAKRWEDVADLLEAGIDVWATLNVQHLESLNDSIWRITGVRVAETLPDHVLQLAAEIELIDLPPEELRNRLREGRVYRPDVAQRALEGFFREGNLSALRELALRSAAEYVDAEVRDYMRGHAIEGPWPSGERVLVLAGTGPGALAAVRHAKRLAVALRAPWVALHVERGAPEAARPALTLAESLGAEIEVRAGRDLVAEVLVAAAARNVTQIVIGRGNPALWRRLTGLNLASILLRRASAYALHVVPSVAGAPRDNRFMAWAAGDFGPWWTWAATAAMAAAITAVGVVLDPMVPSEALGMVYLAPVMAAAVLFGGRHALAAAALGFLCWNFFLIPPRFSFTINSSRDLVAILMFVCVALGTGALAGRVRAEARGAQARIEGLRRISTFSRRLGEPSNEPDLLAEIAHQAAGIAGQAVVLDRQDGSLLLRAAEPAGAMLDEGSDAAAHWADNHQEQTGRGTSTLPSAAWRFIPMYTARGAVGVLGIRTGNNLEPALLQTLEALADQAALALERVRLANEAARAAAQTETQKLRTALLNSLSHDLRTPLAGIRAGAGTLRTAWGQLNEETRADLLASIEQDIERMTRFLANITEMSRLESGVIAPKLVAVSLQAVVDDAISRIDGAPAIAVKVPDVRVIADPALLEQSLVNVLENAVKFSPFGALIRVAGTFAGSRATLSVADEGAGIPREDLPHVFDSFYRARHGDRVVPGTGLGLAIARGLIEAMGGSITATSPRLDRPADGAPGTVVTITLPIAPRQM